MTGIWMLYSWMMIVEYLNRMVDSGKCSTILGYPCLCDLEHLVFEWKTPRFLYAAKHFAIVPCMVGRQHSILLTCS